MPIDVEIYKEFLKEIIKEYGLNNSYLYIVPNIQKWATERGIEERNPYRAAMVAFRKESNTPDFIFLNVIPDDEIESIKTVMIYHGFANKVNKLKDEILFLKHTILHEIAHAKGIKDETAADRWAFEEMDI